MTVSSDGASRDFLLTALAAGGGGTALLLIAARLVARGHRVRFLGEEVQRAAALASGARFVPWEHLPVPPTRASVSDVQTAPISPREELRRLSMFLGATAGAFAAAAARELDRERAAAIVTLDMLHGVMSLCEARGLPLAIISASISPFPVHGVPPFGPGLRPARTPEEAQRQGAIALAAEEVFDAALPGLNSARGALGLQPLAHVADGLKSGMHFLCTARSFDFAPPLLPAHLRYAGPLLDSSASNWSAPWPADDRRPLVLVAFSTTFQNQTALLQHVIDACAPLPIRVLVTLGPGVSPTAIKAADNAHLVEYAPHMAVMRQAAAVITHGGHGTVMAALVNRLPLLVIPQGRDQNDNAVRIAERGAGRVLLPDASAQQISEALMAILNDPGIRAAAQRLGDAVALEERGSTFIAELEALAGRGHK